MKLGALKVRKSLVTILLLGDNNALVKATFELVLTTCVVRGQSQVSEVYTSTVGTSSSAPTRGMGG